MTRVILTALGVAALALLGACSPTRSVPPGEYTTSFTAISGRSIDNRHDPGEARVSARATIRPERGSRTPTRAKNWIRIDRVWTADGTLVVDSPGPGWQRFAEDHVGLYFDTGKPFRASAAQGARNNLPAAAAGVDRIAGEIVRFEAARVFEQRLPLDDLLESEEFVQLAPGLWITARDLNRTEAGAEITLRIWTSADNTPPPHGPDAAVAMDPRNYRDETLTFEQRTRLNWALPAVTGLDLIDSRGRVVSSQDLLSTAKFMSRGSIGEDTWTVSLEPGRSLRAVRVRAVLEERIVREPFDVTRDDVHAARRTLPRAPADD